MTTQQTPVASAQEIAQELDRLESQTPALGELIAAFRPLMAAQAALRAGLPALGAPLPEVDPARLAQGAPLARVEDLLAAEGLDLAAYLAEAAGAVLPALGRGFPSLAPELAAWELAAAQGDLDPAAALEAMLAGQEEELAGQAQRAGVSSAALGFVLLQLARPLLQRRAQALAALLEGRQWSQGSCPICGSLPELAFLTGEGGQRWLRCSLCAHHWRFSRTVCPVCASQEQDQLQFFYAEGRERERVDSCAQCGKYVVTLDARGLDRQPVWEVAGLGLAHLDLLAQQRGLAPAAWCAWNQIR